MKWVALAGLLARTPEFIRKTVGLLFLLASALAISAAPHISIDRDFWEFGTVTNAEYISHDYVISNAGDAPLIIDSVISTCSVCLHASIEATNLPPGATTHIHADLNLGILPGGAISRAILITCNDPQSPTPVVDLNGVSVPAYRIFPLTPLLDLTDGPAVITVQIEPLFTMHAPLSHVECSNTNLQISCLPQTNGACLLAVEAGRSFPKTNEMISITLRSADTNDLPCAVGVFIRNAPSLSVVPTQLTFDSQPGQTRVVWIKQHGPSPATLLDADLPIDRFHCEIDPDDNGHDYTIYVTLSEQTAAAQTNTLILKMMDASNHEENINVPVFVR